MQRYAHNSASLRFYSMTHGENVRPSTLSTHHTSIGLTNKEVAFTNSTELSGQKGRMYAIYIA